MITAYCPIILNLSSLTEAQADHATNICRGFVSDCHKYYIAHYFATKGSHSEIANMRGQSHPPDARLFLGTQFPDQDQSPGRSTISYIFFSDLFQADSDGIYEDFIAKALIVFIYHSWKENYKKRLIASLSISADDVEWDLIEQDIRLVRNKILHNDSVISAKILNRLKILPRIWNIQEGRLMISSEMIQALFEQINSTEICKISP